MRFFFYGTLMDADLASRVIGRRVAPRALRPARLVGWRRIAARGVAYPILARRPAAAVGGRVLGRVTPVERELLAAYEGEGYCLRRGVAVLAGRRAPVVFFAPRPGAWKPARSPWSPARWRRRDRRAALAALAPDRGRPALA